MPKVIKIPKLKNHSYNLKLIFLKYLNSFFIFFLLFVSACFKADKTLPVIFLNQISPVIITFGDDYLDNKVTAQDDRDGDISSLINSTGLVNNKLAGEYSVRYNVMDASGNKAMPLEKMVFVRHRNFTLKGIYQTNCACNNAQSDSIYYSSISASMLNQDEIIISNLLDGKNMVFDGFLSGNTSQKLYFQNVFSYDTLFSCYGQIDNRGQEINLIIYRQKGSFKDTCLLTLQK